jgi:hypothetical protein
MLPKKGNSHSDKRMDLFEKFRVIFPNAEIAYLCGDREFIGRSTYSEIRLVLTLTLPATFLLKQYL